MAPDHRPADRNQRPVAGIDLQIKTNEAFKAMTDQQNFVPSRLGPADSAFAETPPPRTSVEELAKELGLKLGVQDQLTIRRIKRGKNYSFVRANGTPIKHVGTIRRLNSMAVPPAYAEVRYSP